MDTLPQKFDEAKQTFEQWPKGKQRGVACLTIFIVVMSLWAFVWEMNCGSYPATPEDPPPLGSADTCVPWQIPFDHLGGHTFLTLPTGGGEFSEMNQLPPKLDNLGKCTPEDGGAPFAKANWNINYCTWRPCFNGSQTQNFDNGHGGGVLAPPLAMHPKCAWGITKQLDQVYDHHHRHVTVSAPFAVAPKCANWSIMFWLKALMNVIRNGGVAGGPFQEMMLEIMKFNIRLSSSCDNDVNSKEFIFQTSKRGAICWTFVSDFRDLYCHYKEELNVTDGDACQAYFSKELAAVSKGEMGVIYRGENADEVVLIEQKSQPTLGENVLPTIIME